LPFKHIKATFKRNTFTWLPAFAFSDPGAHYAFIFSLCASAAIFITCKIQVMNIYVGNLPATATETDVRNLFKEFGRIDSVNILTDMDTGRSKGFGFVEMSDDGDGRRAIKKLNELNFMDQSIKVSEAIPPGKK
jgi:RNA-binding proteins (RRM domain)